MLLLHWAMLRSLVEELRSHMLCAAAAAKSHQLCPTLCDPIDGRPPGSPSQAFSRQEHWSGLPFPSPTRESEVAQLCLTLSDPMNCSLPGSSIYGIFQARVLEWGAIAFSDMLCGVAKKRRSFSHHHTYLKESSSHLRTQTVSLLGHT